MRSSTLRDLIILLAIGGALFTGGYFLVKNLDIGSVGFDYDDISVEDEEKLGDLFKDMMWDKMEKVENETADSALSVITSRLVDALDSTRYHYKFTILKNDQVNAFTIPGGNIYIFSGLIEAAESPEEVAAVLSHEIGHAEKRHVVDKLVKSLSISVIVSILSGGDPGVLTQVLQQIIDTGFGREQEKEADQYGLALLEKAHVDPKYLAVFFERLNDKDMSYNKNLEILMTHPHNDSRIKQAREYKTKSDFSREPFTLDWEAVQKVVK